MKLKKYFNKCKECGGSGEVNLVDYILTCTKCCGYGWTMSEKQKQRVSRKMRVNQ